MPVPAITQELVRAKHFGIEMQSSASLVDDAEDGDLSLFGLEDGSVGIVNENGDKTYFGGATQNIASSSNGATLKARSNTVELTCSGASVTATGIFPAKVRQVGVAVEVTLAITGATSFDTGDGSDQDRYTNDTAITLGTITDESAATADPGGWSATAGDVVLTANGSNFTAGKVKVTAFYFEYDGAS